MSRNDNKITVLQLIRDKKDILFGAFSDSISKQKKVEEWKNILITCQSLGLVPAGKDYTYVRDTFYSNLKRATLSKRDNARKTGTGGGKKCFFTPIDDLILEIIGKDSPITDGIVVEPTTSASIIENNVSDQNNVPDLALKPTTSQNCPSNLDVKEKRNDKVVRKGSKQHTDVLEQQLNKKRKLDLQLEFLALKNYKLKLEILEMERNLDVEPSELTKEIKTMPQERQKNALKRGCIEDNSNQILLITNDNIIVNEDGTQTVVI